MFSFLPAGLPSDTSAYLQQLTQDSSKPLATGDRVEEGEVERRVSGQSLHPLCLSFFTTQ
jgi:hypothetical protein